MMCCSSFYLSFALIAHDMQLATCVLPLHIVIVVIMIVIMIVIGIIMIVIMDNRRCHNHIHQLFPFTLQFCILPSIKGEKDNYTQSCIYTHQQILIILQFDNYLRIVIEASQN